MNALSTVEIMILLRAPAMSEGLRGKQSVL
jgi:hypothetical protein